ncbi:pyrroline-5-carboxylate reductase [Candidatus Endolissoclinum faulkneri L2]|uniref:Pyrroline-5-carboxylate reductase n=1 Tax=Candidatus Endolissoclinum faulkneri L2 TaxID=1193729 RepID=K7Z2P6_9PROT|nr:pyrroline-5-carboxylate reductase [Candidatus Endolissoclinum faulkneri]AFX98248.1 pyrroline-5-carboxylate reductase [Candidatus Endolissoclinum faulkneri L2]
MYSLNKIFNPLLLIGCGKIGKALVIGWLENGLEADSIHIVDPNIQNTKAISQQYGVKIYDQVEAMPQHLVPIIVVIAVKPQMMNKAIVSVSRFSHFGTCFLSIAASSTISYFENKLGNTVPIVRAMPNIASAVGHGITAYFANCNVVGDQKIHIHQLLETIGEAIEVDNEEQINAVTALSGGGPAYVFLLIETLAKAGIKSGLPEKVAMKLARTTVIGSCELLTRYPSQEVSQLRLNVTSQGGTTAEALKVLMDDHTGIQPIFNAALAAATERSKALTC